MDLEEQHHHAEEVGHVPRQPEQVHLQHPPSPSLPLLSADQTEAFLPPSQARLDVGEWWRGCRPCYARRGAVEVDGTRVVFDVRANDLWVQLVWAPIVTG